MKEKDIVIGVPAKNEEVTIIHVLDTVAEGLRTFFPDYESLIAVEVGGSTDLTPYLAESFRISGRIEKIVLSGGGTGKGDAVCRILQTAKEYNARMVAIVDGDLIGIKPNWIDHLITPIALGVADFVTPRYIRDKTDGGITKLFSYPLVTTLFCREVRQPIGGEVGMGSEMVDRCLATPNFPTDFGIDTFFTCVALAEDFRVHEAPLGPKFHESTTKYVYPEKHLLPMFHQVSRTLFDMMIHYERVWKERKAVPFGITRIRNFEKYRGPLPTPSRVDVGAFRKAAKETVTAEKALMKRLLGEETETVLALLDEHDGLPMALWPGLVYRCASEYKKARDGRVIDLLSGLWLYCYASFVEAVRDLDLSATETLVYQQMLAFFEKRNELIERF
jgi:glycosyltransferase involved in cell wall biosynthesis